MKTYKVKIEGVTPYLMCAFDMTDEKSISKKAEYKDETEAQKRLYKDEEGNIYVPSTQLIGTLIEAAKQEKVKGQRGATYSKFMASQIFIEPFAIPMNPQKFTYDKRAVVVQKARIARVRPCFKDWFLEFNLVVADEELIPKEVIYKILQNAGQFCGIGDFRPNKRGAFGKFIVSKFEELKEKTK